MSLENAPAEVESADNTDESTAVVTQDEDTLASEEGSQDGESEGGETEVSAEDTALQKAEKAAAARQRRIDRLTRQKYEERGRYEAEIAQLRASAAPKADASPEEAAQLTTQQIEARAQELATEMAEAKSLNARCNRLAEDGKKLSPTFLDDFRAVSDEVGGLFADSKPTPLMHAILDADAPHKLVKYLADNPEVCEELADLSERAQIRRIVRLEIEMDKAVTPKPSSAPKPAAPVKGGSTSGAAPDPGKDPEAWIKWRNRQVAQAR